MNELIPSDHHRKSIRLPGFDYSRTGEYFITICAHERQCIFGEVMDWEMRLNDFGQIVREEWEKTSVLRANVELGAFVVMPNHFHAIIHILEEADSAGSQLAVGAYGADGSGAGHTPLQVDQSKSMGLHSPSKNLGAIVRGFKGAVTVQINQLRKTPHIPVWQRNYYEHIIWDEKEYLAIEGYIENNPANWVKDSLYLD